MKWAIRTALPLSWQSVRILFILFFTAEHENQNINWQRPFSKNVAKKFEYMSNPAPGGLYAANFSSNQFQHTWLEFLVRLKTLITLV